MANELVHRIYIPLLYTLIWGLGILVCFSDLQFFPNALLIAPQTLTGICTIYMLFMFECIINLADIAYTKRQEQFNVNFVWWMCGFVLNVFMTLLLCVIFLNSETETFTFGTYLEIGIIMLLMGGLKFMNVYVTNNIDEFMRPLKFNTYISKMN